tara:strand:- start:9605 stop:10327 length:723 start_codon:yes stop_codon:yes gene_type:complete
MAALTAIGGSKMLMAGAGVSAFGSIMGGQAAMEAGKYQKNVADQNATILDNKAEQALNLGYDNVRKFGRGFETAQASTEAAFISAGVKMEGTPMEVLEHNIYEGEIEKMNIMYDARMQSYDFKQAAVSSRMEGQYAMYQARAARSSAIIGAVGTMVGAAGSYMLVGEQAAQAKALMTQNAAYATDILTAQAKNNKILTEMKAMNAKNFTLKINENARNINDTAINNAIKLQKYPMGQKSH